MSDIEIGGRTIQGSVNDLTGDELYQSQQIDDTFNDDITLQTFSDLMIGEMRLIGIERPVAAFEVPKGTKASELEKVLLEQAYTEREYKLTDWMQGAGE